MIALKNSIAGFIVSIIGSFPLGYLNIIALEIYTASGWNSLVPFLLGIVLIESVYILLTIIGVSWLLKHKKMLKITEGFSIVFMLFLAISFYYKPVPASTATATAPAFIVQYAPFFVGLCLNAINCIQIPFWTGWNAFLLQSNYIQITGNKKYFYLIGTSLGTVSGMIAFVFSFQYLLQKSSVFTGTITHLLFPLIFLILAIVQTVKFFPSIKTKLNLQL